MLMALWDLESLPRVPFVIGHPIGQQIRVEGVKLPNDRRYLQAMLQVSPQRLGLACPLAYLT